MMARISFLSSGVISVHLKGVIHREVADLETFAFRQVSPEDMRAFFLRVMLIRPVPQRLPEPLFGMRLAVGDEG